jgi:eukaryotic-like serine/threonine-protein kinase
VDDSSTIMGGCALLGPVNGGPGVPQVPGYETGRLLGIGGSSEVWAATAPDGAPVALKVLRVAGADRAALLAEAALLRRLEHPHVVRLRDVVDVAGHGTVLVLDRCEGGSLAGLVAARGRLDPEEVVTLLVALGGALADLHGQGLVHGDVAPGNVLLTGDGRPVLTDLGLSVVPSLQRGGAAGATPGFGDPALAAGARPTPAADVHGLAATAWYALVGEPPPPPQERPPLLSARPGLPRPLVEVVLSGLGRDARARPSAAHLAARAHAAAPAEPLRLVGGAPAPDLASAVTHRLRVAAASPAVPGGEGAAAAPDRSRPRARRLTRGGSGRRRSVAGAPERPAGGAAPVAARRPQEGPGAATTGERRRWSRVGQVGPALAAGGVALAVVAAAGWLVAGPWGAPAGPGGSPDGPGGTPVVSGEGASAEQSAPHTPTGGDPAIAAPSGTSSTLPSPDRSAAAGGAVAGAAHTAVTVDPRTDPVAAVAALADLRALALAGPDGAALAAADLTGSSALEADARLLAALVGRGVRLDGLAFEVVSAEVVDQPAPGAGAPERVVVRASVVTAAHRQVRTSDGSVVARVPASLPRPALLHLVRSGGGWQVESVRPVGG